MAENLRKVNAVLRYSQGSPTRGFSLTGMAYKSRWTSTDQVPQRLIDRGELSRFGALMRAVRGQHEAEHFAYLREHQNEVLLAGGLREGPESPFGGGLWVLAPMPRERAVQLVERDLYFLATRRPYRLFQWGKALSDIDVTL